MTSKITLGLTGAAGVALAATVAATPAVAATSHRHPSATHTGRKAGAVFVQNDALSGNTVLAYRRAADGTLQAAGRYATGGVGGRLTGAAVDFTASQGALTADRKRHQLFAVNPGSNSVSVFDVHGTRLRLRQVAGTDGTFPVSVAARGQRVFVLNARNGGSIQGYLDLGGRLVAIPAWHRDLGLPVTTGTAEFTHTPGQISFTPDGRHLIVTTKAATNSILVWTFGPWGQLPEQPVAHAETGTVPFAVAFDAAGQLEVSDAGTNAVAAYDVHADGSLTDLGATPTRQQATCWIVSDGNLLAASNAGSATVTTLQARHDAAPVKDADTSTGPGTVDAAFSRDGRNLYVQTGGNGGVDAFRVADDGALTLIGSVTVSDGIGGEGIVAW